jgi:hypothetical protein
VPGWKLTIRHGSDVESAKFDDLDEAVAELRAQALAIRSQGPAQRASALRDFEPRDQVSARLQLTRGGMLGRAAAGVDVRGDGAFVPYRGRLRREELPSGDDTPFEAVRKTLAGGDGDDER